ncbi:apolipoprotein D [Diabrotica virgifera virgifera]|uniref:Apolipoprotein D-like n=1 Tax=Diabrotica virgifera virgifera TaxID=50390 RepID=A0A6P7GGK1_DIAVI|nr:apolipoprotein D [Diabrotica virgifera virgifera]
MFKQFVAVFLVFCFTGYVEMHSYHLGACPVIEPMSGFEMDRMLGIWYVIEKTGTASNCILYNITNSDEPGQYQVEETSQHFLISLTPIKHGYHYRGTLKVVDPSVPARMTVKFPLSVAGSSSFTVFNTDYSTYAGIFTCQKLTFAHRQSATILSRTKTLDSMYINKLRGKLENAQISPYDLSIISQSNCPKDPNAGYNININDETISAHAAAEVIRKAGGKIGDGVEYISEKAKEVYHKISDNTGADHPKPAKQTQDPDAEWLP